MLLCISSRILLRFLNIFQRGGQKVPASGTLYGATYRVLITAGRVIDEEMVRRESARGKRKTRGGKEENPRHVTIISVLDSNKNESNRCLNTNRHVMAPAILTSACGTPRIPLPCAKPRESAFVARPTSSRIHASQMLSLESPHLQSFYEGKSCLPFHTTLAGPTRFNLTSRTLLAASGRGGPIF